MQTINNDMTVLGMLDCKTIGDGLKQIITQMQTDCTDETVRFLLQKLSEETDKIAERFRQQDQELSAVKSSLLTAVGNYNAAIAVINQMNERLAAIEANYDPTIIK